MILHTIALSTLKELVIQSDTSLLAKRIDDRYIFYAPSPPQALM